VDVENAAGKEAHVNIYIYKNTKDNVWANWPCSGDVIETLSFVFLYIFLRVIVYQRRFLPPHIDLVK
jgi:hypothetical protein